jgi:DNA-binding CsgD family transcriptional regulator
VTGITDNLLLISTALPEPPNGPALTAAERDVARLALGGLSNRVIAARRGCSSRTVANQLASVFAKLGAAGRRELRARAAGPIAHALRVAPAVCQLPASTEQWLNRAIPASTSAFGDLPGNDDRAKEPTLSLREHQVSTYAGLGYSNKLIAYWLGLSLSTVAKYLARARAKIGEPRGRRAAAGAGSRQASDAATTRSRRAPS